MPRASRRSKRAAVWCPKKSHLTECTDAYSGSKDKCSACKLVVPEGERIFTCRSRKCKFKKCVYCVTGEDRPVPETDDFDESEEEFISPHDPRGEAFNSVPKKKKNETTQEIRVREKLEISARQAQRVIEAKTNGIPGLMKRADFSSTTKKGTLVQCGQIGTALLGGYCTPFLNEEGNGARMYEGADVNARDPSGHRWKYRRFQRVFLKEGAIPEVYKGNKHFVIQWIHVTERAGKKQENQVRIWVSMWEHVTKGACGVSNQAFLVTPSQIESIETHICPFMAESTHMVAHSRRGWSKSLNKWHVEQGWLADSDSQGPMNTLSDVEDGAEEPIPAARREPFPVLPEFEAAPMMTPLEESPPPAPPSAEEPEHEVPIMAQASFISFGGESDRVLVG